MNGSAEGGFSASFGGGQTKGFQFLVDNIELKKGYTVSEKTKVTMSSAFTVNNGTAAGAFGRAFDTGAYYSPATLGVATFAYSVREAMITHQCGDNWTTSVGLFRTPFGMENAWDRFAMHSYFYTNTYGIVHGNAAVAGALGFTGGWTYNTGVLFNIHGLEWALFTNAIGGGDARVLPSTALRYKFDVSGGDWTLTPVVSAYLGRFYGGPKDIGASAGAMWKMGTLWTNVEFIYANNKPTTGTGPKTWSIWVEPGFDLGFANVSAKWEFNEQTTAANAKTNDMNLSAAISKSYDKLRTRLVYTHANLGGKLGAHGNELRLLVGAEW